MTTIITPTSDRPETFALCERWIARQTVKPSVWIVADDGEEPTRCTMGQLHVRRTRKKSKSGSFRGNLASALRLVRVGPVVIVEDDDWYRHDHVEQAVDGLRDTNHHIWGSRNSRYYNARSRRYCVFGGNPKHASLCQTAFEIECIPWILEWCSSSSSTTLDFDLWRAVKPERRNLVEDTGTVVGIKGLPGRGGIGMGHRLGDRYPLDQDGRVLRDWIGEEDAKTIEAVIDASPVVRDEGHQEG